MERAAKSSGGAVGSGDEPPVVDDGPSEQVLKTIRESAKTLSAMVDK